MLCPARCASFKMDCKLLHQAWKENDKLKIKNWKLEEDVSHLKVRLGDVKILNKLNMKDKKTELNEMIDQNKNLTKKVVCLQAKLDQELQNREKEQIKKNSKISSLKQQNGKLKDKLKAKSQLKSKNDQSQDSEAKIKILDRKLEKAKLEECPICFESISINRKWTAFIPCGHRTCSECADKIAALPRSTKKRKCPNCRENIIGFLVLEGIYEG